METQVGLKIYYLHVDELEMTVEDSHLYIIGPENPNTTRESVRLHAMRVGESEFLDNFICFASRDPWFH